MIPLLTPLKSRWTVPLKVRYDQGLINPACFILFIYVFRLKYKEMHCAMCHAEIGSGNQESKSEGRGGRNFEIFSQIYQNTSSEISLAALVCIH